MSNEPRRSAYLKLPPEPEQRIQRIYCWVAIHADGTEGILSTISDLYTGPLITSKRRIATDTLRPLAEAICLTANAAGDPCRVELRVFDFSEVMT
jgi:hypothetical protein